MAPNNLIILQFLPLVKHISALLFNFIGMPKLRNRFSYNQRIVYPAEKWYLKTTERVSPMYN